MIPVVCNSRGSLDPWYSRLRAYCRTLQWWRCQWRPFWWQRPDVVTTTMAEGMGDGVWVPPLRGAALLRLCPLLCDGADVSGDRFRL